MRSHKIIHKFILLYLVIGLAIFIFLSTAGSAMIQKKVLNEESLNLYEEASNIAQDRSILTYSRSATDEISEPSSDTETQTLYDSLSRLSLYQSCQIWLISPKGKV